jgi:hypothetical protein
LTHHVIFSAGGVVGVEALAGGVVGVEALAGGIVGVEALAGGFSPEFNSTPAPG